MLAKLHPSGLALGRPVDPLRPCDAIRNPSGSRHRQIIMGLLAAATLPSTTELRPDGVDPVGRRAHGRRLRDLLLFPAGYAFW